MATTPIIFSLIDSKNSCFYSRIYISPISYPLVYSGSIVVGDAVATITNDRSPIVTVNLIPNQYECRCIGQDNTYETQFYISVPSSSTPVSASSILYNIQNFTANATASYAISSSYATTASYALNGGGGGSSVWQANGNDIINTNTGRVYITGSDMQINSSIYVPNLTPQTVLITDEYNVVSSGNATTTDLNNIVGTIDNVQTQLNAKYQSGSFMQPSYIQTPWIDYLVDGSPLWNEGRVFYDSTQHTLCVYNDKSNVTLNVGEENWVRIVNKSGAIITNGSAVTISGSQDNRPCGVLAVSTMTSGSTSYGIIGISTEDIAINAEGMITILGAVRSINTSNYNAGDTLYVSSSAGKLTNVKPSIPYEVIKIGIALNSTVNGSILVSPYDVIHASDISGYGDLTVTNNQANININTIPSNSYGRLVFKDSGSERVAIQFLNNQFDAYYTTSGRSNALEIYNNTGSTIFFNSGSERMRITKDGSILVNKPGVTSSAYKVEVNGNVSASAVTATTMAIGQTSNVGSTLQCNGPLYLGTSNGCGLTTYGGVNNLQLYGYHNVNVAGQAGAQYSQATVFDVNGNVAIGVPARSTSGAMTTGRFYVSASNGTDPLITANNGSNNVFTVGAASPIVKISGSAAADTLLDIKTSAGSSSLFVTGSNVGIGTSNPAYTLDVAGTTRMGTLYITSSDCLINNYISTYLGNISMGGGASNAYAYLRGNVVASSTVPVYVFHADLNTGMGWNAADNLALIAGGINVLNVSSSGKVGIGTTNPANELSVVGTVSASAYIGTNVNTTYVTGSNIYGGIVSASAYSASNAGFYTPGSTTAASLQVGYMYFQGFGLGNTFFGGNTYYNGSSFVRAGAAGCALTYMQDQEQQFRCIGTGTAGSTYTPQVQGKISAYQGGTVALGGNISTATDNFTGAKFFVSGSGLVGINNISPATALDVTGTTRTTAFVTPTTLPATLYTGSTYFSGNLLFIYNGSAWRSASLS